MSKRDAIYQEYLARWHHEHPAVVQPTSLPVAALDWATLEPWPHQAKVYTSSPCSVFRTGDGHIVELASTVSGRPLSNAAVFASAADFFAYQKPQDFACFHENW